MKLSFGIVLAAVAVLGCSAVSTPASPVSDAHLRKLKMSQETQDLSPTRLLSSPGNDQGPGTPDIPNTSDKPGCSFQTDPNIKTGILTPCPPRTA